jgi:hypothetical protein
MAGACYVLAERTQVPPELAQLHFDELITRIADCYR